MEKVRVRAAEGAKVLHPVTGRPITRDPKGELVPHTTHVARRIAEKSLVLVVEEEKPRQSPARKATNITTDNQATGA